MFKKSVIVLILICMFGSLYAADDSLASWWIGKPIEAFEYIDFTESDRSFLDSLTASYIGLPYAQEGIDRLKTTLLDSGKYLVVEPIPARGSLGTENVVIYIEFVEAKKLGSFDFRGFKAVGKAELTAAAALTAGVVYDATTAAKTVSAIQQLYRSKGFERVDVIPSYSVSSRTNTLDVMFNITEYDWWIGKPIRSFSYTGLKNVDKGKVDDITYKYLGKQFTKQLYSELEADLNRLQTFSLFQSEASRGGESKNDLIITIQFTELPQIEQILYSGNAGVKSKILEEAVTIKRTDFLSLSQIETAKTALKTLYLERGFAEVVINSSYTVDDVTNKLVLTFNIEEGRQLKVGEILFEGNSAIATNVLQKELSLKVQSLFNSGNFSESKLAADLQAIQLVYLTRGYVDMKITDVRREEITDASLPVAKLRIVFVISEGEQWKLGTITSEGNTLYSNEEIQNVLTMKSGTILDIQKVQSEIGKIADLYWNEGYVENTIELEETRNIEEKTISYKVRITEREQAVVEEVLIRGLVKTKPYVLERELTIKSGDIFSKDQYIKSAQNLYNTGLLTDVVPNIGYGTKEHSLVVTYDVVEGNQMNIGFGVTFGGNVGGFPVSGFLSWQDTNIGGTGRDLSISTELAPDSQNLSLSFSDGWVKDKRWSNAVTLSVEHSTRTNGLILADGSPDTSNRNNLAYPKPFTSYDQWVASNKATPDAEYLMPYEYYQVSLGYTTGYTFMFDAGRLSLGVGPTVTLNWATYETSSFVPYDYLIYEYGKKPRFSNRIAVSTTWDGRDLINNTTKGYVLSQSLIYSGGILGGLSNYIRTSTSASAFLKIFEIPGEKPTPGVVSFNTALSLMLDQWANNQGTWTWNISASKYEYLYIDGMTMARGIEPVFYQKFLWDNSLEFSIQIAENVLWGEVFASATGVSEEISSVTSLGAINWHYAAGAGIKLKIPGFPLGLYLVKNAHMLSGQAFEWEGGSIFQSASDTSGLKLVLAITTSIF